MQSLMIGHLAIKLFPRANCRTLAVWDNREHQIFQACLRWWRLKLVAGLFSFNEALKVSGQDQAEM